MSDTDITQTTLLEANTIIKARNVREDRAQALSQCDWTQVPDAPLTAEQKAAWAAYRQELRDLTTQEGFPWNVTWPTKPA
jgi:hypothetical protein